MEFLAKLILMIRPAQAHGQEIEMGCVDEGYSEM